MTKTELTNRVNRLVAERDELRRRFARLLEAVCDVIDQGEADEIIEKLEKMNEKDKLLKMPVSGRCVC
jgi:hypothetical protein